MNTTYTPVAKQFRKHEADFQMIARQGDVAIYARKSAHMTAYEYEVVIIQKHEAGLIHGKSYPAHETVPSDSQWGAYAWSTNQYARAWELLEREVQKHNFQAEPLWEIENIEAFSVGTRK